MGFFNALAYDRSGGGNDRGWKVPPTVQAQAENCDRS